MGYRSDIVIAITKELYVKCQLLQNIPKAILEEEMHEKNGNCYWFLSGWKWYDSYTEVQDIEAWFDWCADEDENPSVTLSKNDHSYVQAVFGALRLGEGYGDSLDKQEWGSPREFEIYVRSYINNPIA